MNTMFAQKCWESLFHVWPPRKYLEKMRSWGASQSAFYLWGCHLQPKHGIVTLQPSPLHQLKIKDQALKPQNKQNRKWNLYSLSLLLPFFFLGGMICETYGMRRRRKEEELCIEIRPTKTHVPQSKIRPDFIPNLPKFPSWFELQGKQWKKNI